MDRVATVVVVCPLGENTDILEVDVREHARPRGRSKSTGALHPIVGR
jgi:hypothetical protein